MRAGGSIFNTSTMGSSGPGRPRHSELVDLVTVHVQQSARFAQRTDVLEVNRSRARCRGAAELRTLHLSIADVRQITWECCRLPFAVIIAA